MRAGSTRMAATNSWKETPKMRNGSASIRNSASESIQATCSALRKLLANSHPPPSCSETTAREFGCAVPRSERRRLLLDSALHPGEWYNHYVIQAGIANERH